LSRRRDRVTILGVDSFRYALAIVTTIWAICMIVLLALAWLKP
jgi:hypothetical protein